MIYVPYSLRAEEKTLIRLPIHRICSVSSLGTLWLAKGPRFLRGDINDYGEIVRMCLNSYLKRPMTSLNILVIPCLSGFTFIIFIVLSAFGHEKC